jgi:hypothetical protein
MLQIMETRILSVIVYYHLAFFAIGVAMLGMTAGALVVFYTFDATYSPGDLFRTLSWVMSLFACSILLSLILLLNLAIGAVFEPTLTFVVSWVLTITVMLPPYVLLGIAVSLALTRGPQRVNVVYGVDLLGAAAGCLATLALLSVMDAYSAVLLVGATGALAALAFGRAMLSALSPVTSGPRIMSKLELRPGYVLGLLLVVAAANLLLGKHGLRPVLVKDVFESANDLTEERWNSFSRIDMQMTTGLEARLWSPSKAAPHVYLDQGWLRIDGGAGTPLYRYHGNPHELDILRFDLTALAYFIRHQGRSAVIGIGGGRDLQTASIFGFRDITGVEYNPIFVHFFARDYRDFLGTALIPGVRLETDDARSWFSRSREQFDLIQMSLIDTWALTAAGAFTLSENGLYTVNGWKRFLARLTPSGVFTVSRWYAPEHPDETARILSVAMATLMEMRVADPASHLYLASNRKLSTLIVGRAPLTEQDVSTLDATVAAMGYRTLVAPSRASADPIFEHILRARNVDELVRFGRTTLLNLTPTWDGSPFFFHQLRLANVASVLRAFRSAPGVLRGNLIATLTLLTLVMVSIAVVCAVVLAPARSSLHQVTANTLLWSSAYFLLIGVAFMFVEIAFIQRMSLFLGHPIYGLAIVLFGIILATGIGSLLSGRAVHLSAASLIMWPVLLSLYLAFLPLWLGRVLNQGETGSLLERASLCLLTMAPPGILMGFMFPTGIRLCTRIDARITPWLWAVNGSAGVLATGSAVLIAIETSLDAVMWIGAAGYALLVVVGIRLLRLAAPKLEPPSSPAGQSPVLVAAVPPA